MVQDTDVRVVVEGVETKEQYSFISSLEVDEMQRYILSEPVNAESMTDLLFPNSIVQKKKIWFVSGKLFLILNVCWLMQYVEGEETKLKVEAVYKSV